MLNDEEVDGVLFVFVMANAVVIPSCFGDNVDAG
jgi:hypothetical protein